MTDRKPPERNDLAALKATVAKAVDPNYQHAMQLLRSAPEMQEICDALVAAVARLEAAERVVVAAEAAVISCADPYEITVTLGELPELSAALAAYRAAQEAPDAEAS